MRYGVTFSHPDLGNDPGFIKEYAQGVEVAGFDHLLAAEHVIGGHPDRLTDEKVHTYDVPYHEPFVLFGFLGAVTETLELVTSIVILPQRQTALLAKQAAELDLLTGGRLRLGVGVGRNWMEYEALNEDFSNRGARIEEQIEVLRLLWTQELVTFDGQWHRLDRMGLNPMPVQRPIPIWMGAWFGAIVEKVLRRTGRMADGWLPQYPPGPDLADAIARMRGYAMEAGRDPGSVGIECRIRVKAGEDPAKWVELAGAYRDLGATHLSVMTAGGGFSTPQEHLDAAIAWREAMRALD
jgi:probable F420-dependent oxidoreductase